MSETVKVGIVGIGNMGSAHAKSIFSGNIKGMELAAVCDIAESKRLWADENLPGVPCYEDYKEMIDSGVCDTVIVATPHYFHSPIAIYAFEKGKNVLTEKPAGVYTKQVEEMNAAAKKSGKVFGIMYNQRTNPRYQKIRRAGRTETLYLDHYELVPHAGILRQRHVACDVGRRRRRRAAEPVPASA